MHAIVIRVAHDGLTKHRRRHDAVDNTICEGNMMPETFNRDDRKGLTESPCDDASRYTDGDLRLALEEMHREYVYANSVANGYGSTMSDKDAKRWAQFARAYSISCALLRQAIKQKACSAGGTTPTSTPSV